MKLNKLVLPILLALVALMATTGCRKGFNGRITKLPGHEAGIVGGTGPENTLPPGGQMPGGEIPNTGAATPPGGGPTSETWNPDDYIQDRAALAAYTIHFAFDSAVIRDSEQANLASVGQSLTADANAKLLIEGNCDERGTEEYNRALGERRALAARQALAKLGIDPMRIRTISYGKDKPADPGHDEAAWAKNRRDDFVLCHPKSSAQ
jgi:peptidoglycan-associated lipoprotein